MRTGKNIDAIMSLHMASKNLGSALHTLQNGNAYENLNIREVRLVDAAIDLITAASTMASGFASAVVWDKIEGRVDRARRLIAEEIVQERVRKLALARERRLSNKEVGKP